MRLGIGFVAICLLLSATPRATTVIAPSFQELVGEADLVFESEVLGTKARLTVEGGSETIVTDVSFKVARTLKGAPGSVVVLDFLGGEVGDRGYKVDGMPRFAPGDRDVIFAITSQKMVSPLVRFMHGRVRINTDSALRVDTVRQFDGTPIRDLGILGSRAQQPMLSQTPAMSLSAFESAIVAEVQRQSAQKGPRQ